MKTTIALLLLAAAAAPAWAETYEIDRTHTFANFDWMHLGYSHHSGKFTDTKGTVTLDAARKTGSVDVTIQVASMDTGVPKLDQHLQGPEFFDAAKYPVITFKSGKLDFDGDKVKSVTGDLTLHGVTKPVTLKVTHFACMDHPMLKVPACGADAVASIKRSDFGMGGYVPAISDEIALRIEIEAQKAGAAKK
ncbi:MAG TPA: YceI family protein [Candidatus Binatia bacterium]|nr:YceI family protein [Candidatus Binatia bacterium]